ncbi:hypothetical protein LWI28_005325 [Acer negundo]|uniref:Uncharacterized protein n=1 Tax=Acer negundo TaxID=4023 RepID=A0AAD5ID63_ACENE|nr:hypothetical protein LWI28_005325 [Acer negundo]
MFMVCGYKTVIKLFPHQVSDFELAVSLLEKCHGDTNSASNMSRSTVFIRIGGYATFVLLWTAKVIEIIRFYIMRLVHTQSINKLYSSLVLHHGVLYFASIWQS